MKQDITSRIERLPAFEERFNVEIRGLYACVDDEYLSINGEVHSRGGESLSQDIRICTSVQDSSGRVLHLTDTYIDSDDFFSFEAFSEYFECPPDYSKIRVYPKAS
jgi:hypothetical protein